MGADLREKLEALAKEWDAWANTGVDCASALETCADELTDLLASHEEREGGDGLADSLKRHLEDLEYEATGPRYGPATNGFAYAKIPDWLLRQVISALRSHTDRES